MAEKPTQAKNGGGNAHDRAKARAEGKRFKSEVPMRPQGEGAEKPEEIWRSLFAWDTIFRWDVLNALVLSFFVAVGLAMLSCDWFPHNLLISQICFSLAGTLAVLAIVHHATTARGVKIGSKLLFCIPLSSVVILIASYAIWAIQSHKPTFHPSIAMRIYVALGHKKGDNVAGFVWPDGRFYDLRVVVGNISHYPVQNIDLTIKTIEKSDDTFWGMGQISDIPGVQVNTPTSRLPSGSLTLRGADGNDYILDTRDYPFANPFADHWNFFCPRLPIEGELRLSLAAIHPGDNAAPKKLRIVGSYEVISSGSVMVIPVDQTMSVER
ncbi:MAG TPA: hypothetical protein VGG45_03130 [Terracidiphilus sp.]|jgi:hypothetical protein